MRTWGQKLHHSTRKSISPGRQAGPGRVWPPAGDAVLFSQGDPWGERTAEERLRTALPAAVPETGDTVLYSWSGIWAAHDSVLHRKDQNSLRPLELNSCSRFPLRQVHTAIYARCAIFLILTSEKWLDRYPFCLQLVDTFSHTTNFTLKPTCNPLSPREASEPKQCSQPVLLRVPAGSWIKRFTSNVYVTIFHKVSQAVLKLWSNDSERSFPFYSEKIKCPF